MRDDNKRPMNRENKGFGGNRDGERRSQGGFRGNGGEKRFGRSANSNQSGDRPAFRGERRNNSGSDRPQRSFGGNRPAFRKDNDQNGGNDRFKRDDFRGQRGDRPQGERPAFRSDRPQGERPAFRSDRPQGERPAFRSDRPQGERPAFRSDRPQGERPAFRKDRPAGDRPAFRSDRPQGERPAFRKNRPQGERPAFRSDRPAGDRPAFRSDRPQGERPAFRSDRPAGDRPAFRSDRPAFRAPARPAAPRTDAPRRERPGTTDGMPARRIALDVIRNVTENGAYASLYLDEKLLGCGLSLADRRLVSRLVYETLEHLLYIDHALSQVMAREDTDIKLRNILRMGVTQLLLMDRIPEYTATDTSVQLCKELGMEGLGGVCNGILRNLIRKKDELTWPDRTENATKARSVQYSMPEWLVEKLTADWGEEVADAMMGSHGDNNYVTIRPNLMRTTDAAMEELLNKKVWEWTPGQIPHSYHVRGMADISRDTDFAEGAFSIQGESSMMAAMAVAPKRGWKVLDACSAPGGKTCLMAEMMDGTGRVQAWEVRPHRTDLVEAQAKRLKLENVRPMTRDALKLREDMIETMDAVLLDAPCSGTGDMWEKPDVRYRLQPENIAELVQTQAAMLDTVSQYVKRGGVLVYSTCSVMKDENERQIAAFLARNPEFRLDKLPESIPERYREQAETGLQLMPQRDQVGGFYICRLRRKI